ncbi:MAG: response regulator [Anaerolineae bacterium]
MKSLRVLLVDDHEIVRLGLRTLLEEHSPIEIVGEAGTAAEAIAAVGRLRPDVVVMDIRLPGRSGIDACREIKVRWPEVEVLMLTSYAEDELLMEAIQAGAAGYVLKQVGTDDLVRAIEAVGRGEALLDPTVTRRVLERVRQAERQADEAAFAELSERELEVLVLVSEGKSNPEIAEALYLSEKTVRNYVSTILSKLDLNNRVELAAYAFQHRIRDVAQPKDIVK